MAGATRLPQSDVTRWNTALVQAVSTTGGLYVSDDTAVRVELLAPDPAETTWTWTDVTGEVAGLDMLMSTQAPYGRQVPSMLVLTLRDATEAVSPFAASGDFAGGLLAPGAACRVDFLVDPRATAGNTVRRFVGFVERVEVRHRRGLEDVTQLTVVDLSLWLSQAYLDGPAPLTSPVDDTANDNDTDRMVRVLYDAAWPGDVDASIDFGPGSEAAEMQATDYGATALELLHQAAEAGGRRLMVRGDSVAVENVDAIGTDRWPFVVSDTRDRDAVTVSTQDDYGTGNYGDRLYGGGVDGPVYVPTDVRLKLDTRYTLNRVTVTTSGGTAQTVDHLESQAVYGIRAKGQGYPATLYHDGDAWVGYTAAEWSRQLARDALLRSFAPCWTVEVDLDASQDTRLAPVLARLDLNDLFVLDRQVGAPVQLWCRVMGIRHRIRPVGGLERARWTTTITAHTF